MTNEELTINLENRLAELMRRTEETELETLLQANGIGLCTGNLHAYKDMLKLIVSYDDDSNPKECSAMLDAMRRYIEQQIGYWTDARREWVDGCHHLL